MRIVEFLVFLPLAAAVHLGVWSITPASTGASSNGGAGQAYITLASAIAHHNALARTWQSAPQTEPDITQPPPAVMTNRQPAPSAPNAGPTLPQLPILPPVLPAALPVAKPPSPPSPQVFQAPAPAQRQNEAPTEALPPQIQADPEPRRPRPSQPRATRPDTTAQADTRAPVAPPKPGPAPKVKPTPKPKPATTKPSSDPATAQSASGGKKAKTRQAGQSGQDATQSANAAARNALRARWGAKIQRKVHRRLIYPHGATGTGVAQVALTINPSGKLTGLRLTRSSGVAVFDQAALGAVRRAGQFPKAPGELRDQSYSFTLSLSFRP